MIASVRLTLLALLVLVLTGAQEASRHVSALPHDKPVKEVSYADWKAYALSAFLTSAGFGTILLCIFGTVVCCSCCYCCCCASRQDKKEITLEQTKSTKKIVASAAGGLSDRANDLGARFQELQKGDPHHIKTYWAPMISFFIALIICASVISASSSDFDRHLIDVYTGVQDLIYDTALEVCSDVQSTVERESCERGSFGAYLLKTRSSSLKALDDATTFLNSTATSPPALSTYDNEVNLVQSVGQQLAYIVPLLNGNTTRINSSLAYILDPTLTLSIFSDDIPEGPLPWAPMSAVNAIIDTADDLSSTTNSLNTLYSSVDTEYTTALDFILDSSGGTDKELESFFDDFEDILLTVSGDLVNAGLDMDGGEDDIRYYLRIKTTVITVLFFIPVMFHFISLGGSGVGVLRGKPPGGGWLTINMCVICSTLGILCIATGCALFIHWVFDDTCRDFEPFLEVNTYDWTFSTRNGTVRLSDGVLNLIECGHEFDNPATFTAAFDIEDQFDVSKYTKDPLNAMEDAQSALADTTNVDYITGNSSDLAAAIAQLPPPEAFNHTSNLQTSAAVLFTSLPPFNSLLDRNNKADQDPLYQHYGLPVSQGGGAALPWGFNWPQYSGNITHLNILASNMSTTPAGYGHPWNNQSVQYFTLAAANATGSPWTVNGNYDPNGISESELMQQVALLDAMTKSVNASADANDLNRLNLAQIITGIPVQGPNIIKYGQLYNNISDSPNTLDTAATDINNYDTTTTDSLDSQIRGVENITVIIQDAPNFLGCEFVGNFYQNVLRGTMCNGINGDMQNVSGAMVCIALFMTLTYAFSACLMPQFSRDAKHNARVKRQIDHANAVGQTGTQQQSNLLNSNTIATYSPTAPMAPAPVSVEVEMTPVAPMGSPNQLGAPPAYDETA